MDSTGSGEIDTREFALCVAEIEVLSSQLKEGWEIRKHENGSDDVPYLVKRNVTRQLPVSGNIEDLDACGNGVALDGLRSANNEMEEYDEEALAFDEECQSESCQFEYHIIHSSSYNVPVLYFTACKSDGKLLTLEEVWRLVPGSYQDRLRHQRWNFITQQEHPLLGRPFFQLHPCRTADLLKAVGPLSTRNIVVTWLSSVGPVVGLHLPLAFMKLCEPR